ncbi:hypothetical protein [Caldalkalibacillus salinus]|uniref:hypothetical protein n=1 Tax=Caldalkalibacillus salinus TaxID=2803787 RepID=UPI0019229089|nr:hypothetical protein [Caldalkalibacillus salinus]
MSMERKSEGKELSLDRMHQVDRMIDEGLGAGRIVEEHDKAKLKSALAEQD